MAVPCKSSSARVIPITANKKFKRVSFRSINTNLRLAKQQLQDGTAICAVCGFGQKESWRPLMNTSSCPICGSQKKK